MATSDMDSTADSRAPSRSASGDIAYDMPAAQTEPATIDILAILRGIESAQQPQNSAAPSTSMQSNQPEVNLSDIFQAMGQHVQSSEVANDAHSAGSRKRALSDSGLPVDHATKKLLLDGNMSAEQQMHREDCAAELTTSNVLEESDTEDDDTGSLVDSVDFSAPKDHAAAKLACAAFVFNRADLGRSDALVHVYSAATCGVDTVSGMYERVDQYWSLEMKDEDEDQETKFFNKLPSDVDTLMGRCKEEEANYSGPVYEHTASSGLLQQAVQMVKDAIELLKAVEPGPAGALEWGIDGELDLLLSFKGDMREPEV